MEDLKIEKSRLEHILKVVFSDKLSIDNEFYPHLPTVKRVYDALKNKNFDELNDLIIIPKALNQDAITFDKDEWYTTHIEPTGRKVNFSKLTAKLKHEVKILTMSELWLLNRSSKASSLIRKGEYYVQVAKECMKLNILSLFHLSSDFNFEKFQENFENPMIRGDRAVKNIYMALSSVNQLQQTPLSELGYYFDRNFSEHYPYGNSNQHYCIPFSILSKIWKGHMDYFNAFDDNLYKAINIIAKVIEVFKNECTEFKGLGRENGIREQQLYAHYLLYQDELKLAMTLIKSPASFGIYKKSDDEISKEIEQATFTSLKTGKTFTYSRSLPRYRIDIQKFSAAINFIFLAARNALQSFTGMRISETLFIEFGSLIDEGSYFGVKSHLTKYAAEGGSDEVWATAPFSKRIFEVVNKIADAAFIGVEKGTLKNLQIATNYQQWLFHGKLKLMPTQRQAEFMRNFCERNNIVLTADTILEFNRLNPNLHNMEKVNSEIYAGTTWPYRSHQSRRSLAVHSRRLDLLDPGEISWQFKHLTRAMADWYGEGGDLNSIYQDQIPEIMIKELDRMKIQVAAETAIRLQNTSNLFGKGGETLEKQQTLAESAKVYPSLKKAKQLARKNQTVVMSLGNGMYCLNGQDCKMSGVIQSSTCNPKCENLIADEESTGVWLKRYNFYREKLKDAQEAGKSEAICEYLRLELEYYKDALSYYKVIV